MAFTGWPQYDAGVFDTNLTFNADAQQAIRLTIPEKATITGWGFYHHLNSIGDFRAALYTDDGGKPGTLLASSGTRTAIASRWLFGWWGNWPGDEIDVDAGDYWLSIHTATASTIGRYRVGDASGGPLTYLIKQNTSTDEFDDGPAGTFYTTGLSTTYPRQACAFLEWRKRNGVVLGVIHPPFNDGTNPGTSSEGYNHKQLMKYELTHEMLGGTALDGKNKSATFNAAYLPMQDATTTHVRAVVYSDNAGAPDALLGTSDELTSLVAGVNKFTFSTPVTLTPGTYWIGFINDEPIFVGDIGYGEALTNADTYAGGPSDPAGAMSASAGEFGFTLDGTINEHLEGTAQEDDWHNIGPHDAIFDSKGYYNTQNDTASSDRKEFTDIRGGIETADATAAGTPTATSRWDASSTINDGAAGAHTSFVGLGVQSPDTARIIDALSFLLVANDRPDDFVYGYDVLVEEHVMASEPAPVVVVKTAATLSFYIASGTTRVPFGAHDLDGASFTLTCLLNGVNAPQYAPAVTSFTVDDPVTPRTITLHLSQPLLSRGRYTLWTTATFITAYKTIVSPTVELGEVVTPRGRLLGRLLSNVLDPEKTQLRALIAALAYSDEKIGDPCKYAVLQNVRLSTALKTATGDLLDRCANAYSLKRLLSMGTDELFRQLCIVLAVVPKANRARFHAVLKLFMGEAPFYIYEPSPGEAQIEIFSNVATDSYSQGSDHTASWYLKADETVAATADNPGDYLPENPSATGPAGRSVVLFDPGALVADMTSILDSIKASGVKLTITIRNTGF